MGAAATLVTAALAVEPGGEVTSEIVVRNTGEVVDQFTVTVLGDVGAFTTVTPATVSLFPGTEETVTLRFAPPRSPKVPAGTWHFGVKISPKEDPEGSTVEEGALEVGRIEDLSGELLPRTSRARRRAVHEVALDNRGNSRVTVRLTAADADQLLGLAVVPAELSIPAGAAAFARVTVRPKQRMWRGQAKTLPFQVAAEPDHGVPIALDGGVLHEALLPRWLPKALIGLALLLIALAVLWFALLRPTLESAAQEAADEEVAAVAADQSEAEAALEAIAPGVLEAIEEGAAPEEALAAAAGAAQEVAAASGLEVPGALTGGGGAPTSGGAGVPGQGGATTSLTQALLDSQGLGDPFDFRLARAVPAGATEDSAFTIPDASTFALTDIVLQNPNGDAGTLEVLRQTEDDIQGLLEVRLENFRTDDYHFVSPVVFLEGQDIVLTVSCENEGSTACDAGAYFSGFRNTAEAAAAQPTPQATPADRLGTSGATTREEGADTGPDLTVDDLSADSDDALLPGLEDEEPSEDAS